MPYDLTGRSLTPLSQIISEAEFPLADYLPVDDVASLFSGLYVAEANLGFEGDNLVVDCHLAFADELAFALPGADSYAFVLGSAGPDWTAVKAIFTIGPDASLVLSDLTLGLRFDPEVLRDHATGNPAAIEFACTVRVSPDGFAITDYAGLRLDQAALCGTEILVAADALKLVFAGDEPPAFLADQDGFVGVAFASLAASIPGEYLALDASSVLNLEILNGAIGSTGFTGETSFQADPNAPPITGQFLGFDCRIREFALDVVESSLVAAGLGLDLRLEALEQGNTEKWVALDVAFDQGGGFAAQAAAAQPPDASTDPGALITLDYPGAVKLALNALRLTRDGDAGNAVWAIYFSGELEILVPGATWPEIGFDELGVSSDGDLLLPEGGGITFASPLVVAWHFVRLTVPKFRFGRPEGSDHQLQVQLAAEVELLEGLPSGASVEGLTITWDPGSGAAPDVSFTGIGLRFGIPGCFSAAFEVGFIQDGGSVEFRGQGQLELSALDMGMQIGVVVGYDQPADFAYLYLFADAKLLPTGIPIGQSGLSIYGFQGLIAYNMALAINPGLPVDERYYTLFVAPPIGITDIAKWRKQEDQNALGIGVVLGTADKGFAFNVKGLFVVAFPDLVLLLQAKVNVLKLKPDLSTQSEGSLDALMVLDSAQDTFTFDIVAFWGMPSLVEVTGSARAFFDFDDPGAFYLRIGQDQDTKRVSAKVVRWGDKWLFTAGFWFELNQSGIITGVLIDVGVRYEKAGFWIEATGSARGELALFWEPPQWEGAVALAGRIGAGYRGLSVSIGLGGSAQVRVARPFDVRLRAEACFEFLWWETCKGHTFTWERLDPPALARPLRSVAAKPADWTLKVESVPLPDGGGGQARADTGIVPLTAGTTGPKVQPHSAITLDFAKPMIDNTGRFNEAVPLPHNGYLTVGEGSDYAAAYELIGVRLVRDPQGDAEAIALWGTWALETPNYNSSLRLFSSDRFGHDGSLTESFVDGVELDYCGLPDAGRTCLSLAGIEPGYGWIDNRVAYHWDVSGSTFPEDDRRNQPFVELLPGDRLTLYLPAGATDIQFEGFECPRRPPRQRDRDGDRRATDREDRGRVLGWPRGQGLLPRWLRPAVAWVWGDEAEPAALARAGTTRPGRPRDDGGTVIVAEGSICLDRVCYQRGHGAPELVIGTRRGGTQTQRETWTVPAAARLLRPGDSYDLTIEFSTRLREPSGAVSEQAAAQQPWTTRFEVDGPPRYPRALAEYVAATYPAAGSRPIYTGYDFAVRFGHDYVPLLYTAAQQQLMIRLFDGQGRPVTDPTGAPVLLPASRLGAPDRSVSESYWERQYLINVEEGCIVLPLGGQEGETTLTVEAPGIVLTPNSQYLAQLVSDAGLDQALYDWSFTTSSFATFTDLVTANRLIQAPRPVLGPALGADFETLARHLTIATIAYVDRITITPIVSLDRTRCLALLVEAPEPLDLGSRLSIQVDNGPVEALANRDETRLLVRGANGGDWPTGSHQLNLSWSRGQAGDPAERQRAVAGVLGSESVAITVPSGGI